MKCHRVYPRRLVFTKFNFGQFYHFEFYFTNLFMQLMAFKLQVQFTIFLISFSSLAQLEKGNLPKIIIEKDSLFWLGYNSCNYQLMDKFLDKNVEFYHDKGGITLGADKVLEATRNNICGNPDNKVRREAILESIKVFPMEENGKIYGAILSGEHYFFQNEKRTGIAKFTHTWLLKEGDWRMHRILSYDHNEATNTRSIPVAKIDENALNQFVGKYNSPQFGEVEIKQNDDILQLINNGTTMELLPKETTTFFVKDRNFEFRFEKGVKFDVIENGQKVDEAKMIKASQKPSNIFESKTKTEAFLAENKIPAMAISAIKNGKIEKSEVYGNLKANSPAPQNAIFNVASLTKPVVAYLTLKLVSQGKWKLDEPLYKYWIDPDLKDDPRHKILTTRLVLTHQTGFPNWRYGAKDQKLAFQADPGTKYGYSGEGFEYLRKALEKKFKKPLEVLIQKNVFNPLKMNSTYMKWSDKVDENRFAVGHDKEGKPIQIYKERAVSGADDLLTTIDDYNKLLLALMNGDGLSKAVFEEMQSNQIKTKENKYFGLGLEKYDIGNGEFAISHGGSDEGCRTIFFIFPKTKDGLMIFTNSDNGMATYMPAIQEFLGEKGQKVVDIEMKK